MWNILNFEISRMRERHSKRNRTIFGDYWLCKIPYKGISTLYLLYELAQHKILTNKKYFRGVLIFK